MKPCPYPVTKTARASSMAYGIPSSTGKATAHKTHATLPLPTPTAWQAARHWPIFDVSMPVPMFEVAEPATPLDIAINQASALRPAEVDELMAPCAAAAAGMVSGRGTQQQWQMLCGAVNIAQSIEQLGVVRGMSHHIVRIKQSLEAIANRAGSDDSPPRWSPTPLWFGEIEDVRLLITLHRYQLEQISYGEFLKVRQTTIGRVLSGGGKAFDLPKKFTSTSHAND